MPRLLKPLLATILWLGLMVMQAQAADVILPDMAISNEDQGQLSGEAQAEILKRCQDAGYAPAICEAVMAKISQKSEKWLSVGQLTREPDYGLDSSYAGLPRLLYTIKPGTAEADPPGNKKLDNTLFTFVAEPMIDKGFWQIGAPYKFVLENPKTSDAATGEAKNLHRFRIELACRPNGVPLYDAVKECRLIIRRQISPLTTEMLQQAAGHQAEPNAIDDDATVWQVFAIIRFNNGLSRQAILADRCEYADGGLKPGKQDRVIALLPEWRTTEPGTVKPSYAWRIDYAGNIFPIQSTGLQCTRNWLPNLDKQLGYFLNPYTNAAKLKGE